MPWKKWIVVHYEGPCLVQDTSSKWNSAYYVADRISEPEPLSSNLCAIGRRSMSTDSEYGTIEQ